MSYIDISEHPAEKKFHDRVATVSAKLQRTDRPELVYLGEALGLSCNGKTDAELRHALISMMN